MEEKLSFETFISKTSARKSSCTELKAFETSQTFSFAGFFPTPTWKLVGTQVCSYKKLNFRCHVLFLKGFSALRNAVFDFKLLLFFEGNILSQVE